MDAVMRKPDFFIVGAPKCGTTAIYAYLKGHPEIFLPNCKEPHFFGADIPHPRRLTPEEYISLFAEARDEKRLGEASISYLFSQVAATEIREFNPSSRIIIMLRNPVEMLYSWHSQLLFLGIENVSDFERALNLEEKRKQGLCRPDPDVAPQAYYYREVVRYTPQVRRYLDTFGRERVHIIIFDDLRSDRVRVFRETLRFLAVTDDFQAELKVVNPNKVVRSGNLQTFLRQPPPFVQALARALMPRRVREVLYDRARRLNTSYKPRPPMDPELKKRLRAEFAPDVEELGALLGRDLSQWSKQ